MDALRAGRPRPSSGSVSPTVFVVRPGHSHTVAASAAGLRSRPLGSYPNTSTCVTRPRISHIPEPASSSSPQSPAARAFGVMRNWVRQAVISAVRGRPNPWAMDLSGRVLSHSRTVRESAFYGRVHDELIPRSDARLRVIDIGCATGALIASLLWLGWEIEGSRVGRCRCREGPPLDRYAGLGRGLPRAGIAYRVLRPRHHVPRGRALGGPGRLIPPSGALLKPGGRLVLFYPNPTGVGARRYGPDWFGWDPPRHLVMMTRRGFTTAAGRAGLEVVSYRTRVRSWGWSAESFALSECYRDGRPVRLGAEPIRRSHRYQARLEGILVAAGFDVGEEVVAVLERPAG